MKSELSSLDLHYLIREFEELVDSKVEQVYQIGSDELFLQLHCPGKGKRILRCVLGKLCYVASSKPSMPEKPHGFCLFLRRRIKNARVREISQTGFERVIKIMLETKDAKFILYVELFSKGNIILCDENNMILSVLHRQEWKDRSLKQKEIYTPPKREYDAKDMSEKDLKELLLKSQKENLVKAIAIELGFGGVYAEEICALSNIDKSVKPSGLTENEMTTIFEAIKGIVSRDIKPCLVLDEDENVIDITPFDLEQYSDNITHAGESLNGLFDKVFTVKSSTTAIEHAKKQGETKLEKIEVVINEQKNRIAGLQRSIDDNQRKGELIYENYPLVQQSLAELSELRKTMSWKEIKEHFKGHQIICSVDVKTGEVTLDI